jgi:CPA2 family monovalent cation:H+ antiporter-2
MNGNQVWEVIAFLAAVVIFIPIFYRLKVNPLLAFIGAGIILGPQVLGLIQDTHVAENIGELGLLFLMFTIGLDLSFHRFKVMRLYIFGLGVAQLLATALVLGGAAFLMHKKLSESLVIGVGLAMSSTAVALRLIQARGDLHSLQGRASVGILLLQDLAVIPVMVLLPRLAHSDTSVMSDVGASLLKAVGAVTLIILIGRMVMKPLFRIIVATKSPEAFTAAILLVFLGMSWATNMAGLSISLGAFLGGMLIAETEFGHEVEAEISSASSLLLGVFFLSVGMMIDVHYAWTHIPQILLLTAAVMAVKFVIIYYLDRRFGLKTKSSVSSAVVLCQAGEFGFVIFGMASQNFSIISRTTSSQLQVVIALSMALTPFLSSFVHRRLDALAGAEEILTSDDAAVEGMDDDDEELRDHVVLIGYGRVGQTTARMLDRNGFSFLVVDTDIHRLEEAQRNKRKYLFGNATNPRILNIAGITRAKAVVIALSGYPTACAILSAARLVSKDVPIFVRCDEPSKWAELTSLGATGVIAETLECGIRLGASVVLSLGGDDQRVKDIAAVLRQENTINLPLPGV